jgi:hypothetical protein
MSAPVNPTPNPESSPQTLTVRIPVAKSEPAAQPPAIKKGTVPPPLPAKYQQSAGETQSTNNAASEVGKPHSRTPEIKLAAPVAAAPPVAARTAATAMPAPRKSGSVWLVRVGLFAGLGFALALLYWSVFVRLLPITSEHNSKARQMTRAADELEMLRRKFSPEEIEALRTRYARAQEALFDLKDGATDWQTQIEEQARVGTLDLKVKVGAPAAASTNVNGISAITAEVTLQPSVITGTNVTAYARLLKFTGGLASSSKRVELLELSVTGDSNSVSQAQVVMQLLAGEKKL